MNLYPIDMKNFYPVWHSASHGPACSATELAALYESHDAPNDVIHFVDEENLVYRLRLIGWKAIADSIAPADEPLSHGWRYIEGDSARDPQ